MNKKQISLMTIPVLFLIVAVSMFQAGAAYQRNVSIGIDVGMHSFHTTAYVTKADGSIIDLGYHAGVLTTSGKDYIEGKLADTTFANATAYTVYISLSNSTSTPAAAWKDIPGEIVTGGLERVAAAYASTGAGVWTLTYQWTASATNTGVQCVGFNWDAAADSRSLLWADVFTPCTLASGDKLTVTGTSTVS